MGNGVTGPTTTPAQTTNTSSGATSRADAAAQAEFNKALAQEQCPAGLHRPSRHDPPCNYLRPPTQPPLPSKPVNINIQGDPDRFKSPMSTKRPDLSRPPTLPSNDIKPPEGPGHNTGLGDDGHIGTWEWKTDIGK